MRAQNGFSIVELLIAIAIMLVMSAIAIPGVLRSRIAANESGAVGSMHQIDVAQTAYAATYPAGSYATALAQLGPPAGNHPKGPAASGMLDSVLGCAAQPCFHAGYAFALETSHPKPVPSFHLIAMPLHPGLTGGRGFCDDQTHTLLYDPQGNANCTQRME
jgi:prepilin-type N-terminal cleavage/methylation domain-containing protein